MASAAVDCALLAAAVLLLLSWSAVSAQAPAPAPAQAPAPATAQGPATVPKPVAPGPTGVVAGAPTPAGVPITAPVPAPGNSSAGSILATIFASPAAANYSSIWELLEPLSATLEQTATGGTPITLLVPSNAALAEYSDALAIALSLMPTAAAKQEFVKRLLSYHVLPVYVIAAQAMDVGPNVTTLLGQTLYHSSLTFSGTATPRAFGNGTVVSTDLQAASPKAAGVIAVHGINGLLIPGSVGTLVPTDLLAGLKFGTDPPLPTVTTTPNITAELKALLVGSPFAQFANSTLSNFTALATNLTGANLLPLVAQLAEQVGGVTVLAPLDVAFAAPWWQLTTEVVGGVLPGESLEAWLRNVAFFHVIQKFLTMDQWLVSKSPGGNPTALSGAVLYNTVLSSAPAWFAAPGGNTSASAGNTLEYDLQGVNNTLISMQGIDRILIPANASLLVPPSAQAVGGPNSTASPPPPKSARLSKGLSWVASAAAAVLAFCMLP